MANMASWGPMAFEVQPHKLTALEGLTTSLTLKQDSENDTSGTQPTNTRGRDLRPISFKVTYLAAVGVNPRAMISAWEAQLGNAYPLIIGGERFGAEKMKLTKVNTSDVMLSNSGGFIKAVVTLTMEEYSEGTTSKLVSTSSTTSYLDQVKANLNTKKTAALDATASASDRAAKKIATDRRYTL